MDYYITIITFLFVLFIFGHTNELKNQLKKIEKMLEEKNENTSTNK